MNILNVMRCDWNVPPQRMVESDLIQETESMHEKENYAMGKV